MSHLLEKAPLREDIMKKRERWYHAVDKRMPLILVLDIASVSILCHHYPWGLVHVKLSVPQFSYL